MSDLGLHDQIALQVLCAVLKADDLRMGRREYENAERRQRLDELLAGAREFADTFLDDAADDVPIPYQLTPLGLVESRASELEQAVRAFLEAPGVRGAIASLDIDPQLFRRLAEALEPRKQARREVSAK
jgi:hypothetical protein